MRRSQETTRQPWSCGLRRPLSKYTQQRADYSSSRVFEICGRNLGNLSSLTSTHAHSLSKKYFWLSLFLCLPYRVHTVTSSLLGLWTTIYTSQPASYRLDAPNRSTFTSHKWQPNHQLYNSGDAIREFRGLPTTEKLCNSILLLIIHY